MIQFLLLFLFIWDGLSWPHSVALLSLELTTIFFAVLEHRRDLNLSLCRLWFLLYLSDA